jgi:hypothetical protein
LAIAVICVTSTSGEDIAGAPRKPLECGGPRILLTGPSPRVSICINVTSQCGEAQRERPSASNCSDWHVSSLGEMPWTIAHDGATAGGHVSFSIKDHD